MMSQIDYFMPKKCFVPSSANAYQSFILLPGLIPYAFMWNEGIKRFDKNIALYMDQMIIKLQA